MGFVDHLRSRVWRGGSNGPVWFRRKWTFRISIFLEFSVNVTKMTSFPEINSLSSVRGRKLKQNSNLILWNPVYNSIPFSATCGIMWVSKWAVVVVCSQVCAALAALRRRGGSCLSLSEPYRRHAAFGCRRHKRRAVAFSGLSLRLCSLEISSF